MSLVLAPEIKTFHIRVPIVWLIKAKLRGFFFSIKKNEILSGNLSLSHIYEEILLTSREYILESEYILGISFVCRTQDYYQS